MKVELKLQLDIDTNSEEFAKLVLDGMIFYFSFNDEYNFVKEQIDRGEIITDTKIIDYTILG